MAAESTAIEQDVLTEAPKLDVAASPTSSLQKEIASFSQLASEAAASFPPPSALQEALRFLLECPFLGTPRRVAAASSSSLPDPGASSVGHLRALVNRWRRSSGRNSQENDYLSRVEHFLKDLQFQRRLYFFFLRRIYAPLYRSFFELEPGQKKEEDEESGAAFFLTECEEKEEEEGEKEETMRGPPDDLAALELRWRRILEEDLSLTSAPFETTPGEAASGELGAVLRLLPDLSSKCRLGAELAARWLSDHRGGDSAGPEEDLKVLRKALLKKEGEMRRGEHSLTIFERELETLQAREERVLALCSNCAQLEQHRDSLSEEYASLVRERQNLTAEIENTIQGTQRLRDLSRRLKELEVTITNQYGELQMVEYALNIAANDYDLHMSLQPSFYAFSRTTRDKLGRAKVEQHRRKGQLAILQKRYDRARGLIEQKRHVEAVVESSSPTSNLHSNPKVAEDEGGGTKRPATNETYTKFRVADRYSDAGQRSGSSGSDDGSGNDADEEVSDRGKNPFRSPALVRPRGRVKLIDHSAQLPGTVAEDAAI